MKKINKKILIWVLIIGSLSTLIVNAMIDSKEEKVMKQLIEKRVEWGIKENTIVELRKVLDKEIQEKLALEPQIRELQSQLDSLVGKKQ